MHRESRRQKLVGATPWTRVQQCTGGIRRDRRLQARGGGPGQAGTPLGSGSVLGSPRRQRRDHHWHAGCRRVRRCVSSESAGSQVVARGVEHVSWRPVGPVRFAGGGTSGQRQKTLQNEVDCGGEGVQRQAVLLAWELPTSTRELSCEVRGDLRCDVTSKRLRGHPWDRQRTSEVQSSVEADRQDHPSLLATSLAGLKRAGEEQHESESKRWGVPNVADVTVEPLFAAEQC